MRDDEYRAMFEMEEHLWWYAGMREITGALLDDLLVTNKPKQGLDIGCGTGFSLRWLRKRFNLEAVFGVDFSPHAATLWKQTGLSEVARGSATHLPFASQSFNLLTCFDVIYQFQPEDVHKALAECYRTLATGGWLFIREPAYDWMRGAHDEAVGTQHRFRLRELSDLISQQGFTIKHQTYANTFLLPLAIAHRLASKMRKSAPSDVRPIHPTLNRWFRNVLEAEARILRRVRFPFGLSVIVLAQKAAAHT